MAYSTGELAELTGMSREGIRFMEKRGVIESQRNAANGYREFDNDQLIRLSRTRSYCSLGFSLEEAKEIYENISKDRLEAVFTGKIDELEKKRREIEKMEQALREQQFAAEFITGKRSGFEINNNPEIFFFPRMKNRKDIISADSERKKEDTAFTHWIQNTPATKMLAYYDPQGAEWKGIAAYRRDYEKLYLPKPSSLIFFGSSACLHGVIAAEKFKRPDFSEMKKWAADNGYKLTGQFLCLLQLSYLEDNGNVYLVHEIYAPVETLDK